MSQLILEPNFGVPGTRYFRTYTPGDDFYECLIEAHRDLSAEQSQVLNARLILILSNHVGDNRVLAEALKLAREDV